VQTKMVLRLMIGAKRIAPELECSRVNHEPETAVINRKEIKR